MIFNVAQLLKEPVGATRERALHGELADIDEHNPGPTPIEGRVLLVRTPRGVLITGEARLNLVRICRRCLEPLESAVTLEIEEEFVPSVDVVTGISSALSDEDTPEIVIDEHHIIDMTEVMRQLAVAANAGMGLCRSDCKGLCAHCGASLNEGPCACEAVSRDPRLVKLAQLLTKQ